MPERDDPESELEDLKQSKRRLLVVIGELAHEGRRVRDGLERVGGADRALQTRLRDLAKTIRMNEAEVDRVEARIAALAAQLEKDG